MLHGGEMVLVAVSGGPDSVALLDVLAELASRLDLRLAVGHVHHGLRAEAEADADRVRAHAERLGLAYFLERVSVRRAPPWEVESRSRAISPMSRRMSSSRRFNRSSMVGSS